MKRGFTLVELLAVIVLIAIIGIIGVVGITKVRNNIKADMCRSTVDMIVISAVHYGEDYHNQLTKSYNENGVKCSKNCLRLKVQDLIDEGYITTKDTLKNETNDELLYNKYVYIYTQNEIVYATMGIGVKCN